MIGFEPRDRHLAVVVALALMAEAGGAALPFAQTTEVVTEAYADGTVRVQRTVRRLPDGSPVNDGPYESYYESGKLESKGEYRDGRRDGEWEFRWPGGRRRGRGSYANGKRVGKWTTWYEKGGRSSEGSYTDGHRTGEWQVWKPDKSLDEGRSGTYDFVEAASPDGTHEYRGALLNGLKDGPWVYARSDGVPMFAADYDVGRLDEVVFFHRDGCVDLEWGSGRYLAGKRAAPLREPCGWLEELDLEAPGEPVPRTPWEADEDARELVEEVLGADSGTANLAVHDLVALGREAVPAVVDRLVACDLQQESERDGARRLHAEVLAPIFGGGVWSWPETGDAEGLARMHRLVDRWDSAWSLLKDDEEAWAEDFDPDYRWLQLGVEDSALGRPPLPDFLLAPSPGGAADSHAGLFAIGGGDLRGSLREASSSACEALFANALERIRDGQERDGSWHSAEDRSTVQASSLALLALLGDGSDLMEGPFRETVFRGARWLVERQNPSGGRIGTSAEDVPVYAHALATSVLAELVTRGDQAGDRRVPRAPCAGAVRYLTSCVLEDGSFPRRSGQRSGDVEVTAMAVTALRSAGKAGIELDAGIPAAAAEWLLGRTEDVLAESSAAGAGAIGFSATLAGIDPADDERLQRIVTWLHRNPPSKAAEAEALFLCGHAARRAGGETWEAWEKPLQQAFLARAPASIHLEETALLVLSLEVYPPYGHILGGG